VKPYGAGKRDPTHKGSRLLVERTLGNGVRGRWAPGGQRKGLNVVQFPEIGVKGEPKEIDQQKEWFSSIGHSGAWTPVKIMGPKLP